VREVSVTGPAAADTSVAVLHADGSITPGPVLDSPGAEPAGGCLPPDTFGRLAATYRAIQASQADVTEVMRLTVHNARSLLGADYSSVWRSPGGAARRGTVEASVGHNVESWAAELAPEETGIGQLCIDRGQPVLAVDYPAYTRRSAWPVSLYLARSEAAATVLSLPLREGGGAVSVLYVARRDHRAFDAVDIALASALAGQAALALQNGRLRRELDEQHALLEHSVQVARRLSRATAANGVAGLCRALAREIGRGVEFTPLPDDEHTAGAMVFAVVAGRDHYGDLCVYGRPLNATDGVSVDRATGLVAREIMRQRTSSQAHVRTGAQLLGSLLDGAPPDQAHIAERARRIGFDLARPVTVVALAHEGADLADVHATVTGSAGLRPRDVLVGEALECLLVVVAVPRGWAPDEMLRALLDRTDVARVGVSATGRELVAASDEAMACLSLALGSPRRRVVLADDLGPLWFLLGAPDAVVQLQRHVSSTLAPTHAAQERTGAPLLETLDAYVSHGRRLAATSDALGVHQSTVKYRLARVREHLARPLDGDLAFDLWLALRAREVLTYLGHQSFVGAGDAAD
jgi:hypothetical protein